MIKIKYLQEKFFYYILIYKNYFSPLKTYTRKGRIWIRTSDLRIRIQEAKKLAVRIRIRNTDD